MAKHNTRKATTPKVRRLRRPRVRKLTIEVREEVAAQLDKSVGTRARYGSTADVAARVVEDYHELLEEVDHECQAFIAEQYHRARKSRFKLLKTSEQ